MITICLLTAFMYSACVAPLMAKSPDTPVRLMGEFIIEGTRPVETIPSFTLYFDGNLLTSDSAGTYTIALSPDDVKNGRLDDFSLLICKRFGLEYEQGHTIAGLKMKKLEKCSWYKLDREYDAVNKKHFWKITEQEIQDNTCVPEKCLVVLISSQNVVAVRNSTNIEAHPDFVDGILPTIVVKADEHTLGRAAIKSRIESIDLRKHTTDQRVEKVVQSGVECKHFIW